MASALHGKTSFQRPPRRRDNCGPGQGTEPAQGAGSEAPPQDDATCRTPCQPCARSPPREKHMTPTMEALPSGKQQLMEKFFSPVLRPQSSEGGAGGRGPSGECGGMDLRPRNHHLQQLYRAQREHRPHCAQPGHHQQQHKDQCEHHPHCAQPGHHQQQHKDQREHRPHCAQPGHHQQQHKDQREHRPHCAQPGHHQQQHKDQQREDKEGQGSAATQGGTRCDRRHHGHCDHHGCRHNATCQCGHSHHSQSDHHRHQHQHHQHQQSTDAFPNVFTHNRSHVSGSDSSTSSFSSSSSFSSMSSSSTSSLSSSTLSSEVSVDNEMFLAIRKPGFHHPRHSLSCTDISVAKRNFEVGEDEEDTRPLLEDHVYKSAVLAIPNNGEQHKRAEKSTRASSSSLAPARGKLKSQQSLGAGTTRSGSFRKAKSMESLPHRGESVRARAELGTWNRGAGISTMGQNDLEKKREEARQTFVKEKLQFSAFLDEITRQVLSPSRLSSLGVTETSRPCSPSPRKECRALRGKLWEGKPRELERCSDSPGSEPSSKHSLCSKPQPCHHHVLHQRRSASQSSLHGHCHAPRCQVQDIQSESSISTETSLCQELGCNRRYRQQKAGFGACIIEGTSSNPDLKSCLPKCHPHHLDHVYHQTPHSHFTEQHHPAALHSAFQHAYQVTSHQDTPASAYKDDTHSRRRTSSQRTTSPRLEVKQECHSNTVQKLKGKMSKVDRICPLYNQNKDLHQSLLQTVMCEEYMGPDLKSNHQQLEAELQSTRARLLNLKDKFKSLQERYSDTQQANCLLEQKLHSVAQKMDTEHECFNQRISELTKQLSTAKTTIQTLETINEALEKHVQSDKRSHQLLLHTAPPPAQFMGTGFTDLSQVADSQSLGAVLEEEDSDWSQAEEILQLCGQVGSEGGQHGINVFVPLKHGQGCGMEPGRDQNIEAGTGSESGDEEASLHLSPSSMEIPHLKVTMHTGTIPISITDSSPLRLKALQERSKRESDESPATCKLGSSIHILSASLEEIQPQSRMKPQGQHQPSSVTLKCTEAMLDPHHAEEGALKGPGEDADLSNRTKSNIKGKDGGNNVSSNSILVSYQSARRMLNRLIYRLHPTEAEASGRVAVPGWAGGVTEEVLNGERTQL